MAADSIVRIIVTQGAFFFCLVLMLAGIILWMRRAFHWGHLMMMAGWLLEFLQTTLSTLTWLTYAGGLGFMEIPAEVREVVWMWISPALGTSGAFLMGLGMIIAGNGMRKAAPPTMVPSGYAPPIPAGGWQQSG